MNGGVATNAEAAQVGLDVVSGLRAEDDVVYVEVGGYAAQAALIPAQLEDPQDV